MPVYGPSFMVVVEGGPPPTISAVDSSFPKRSVFLRAPRLREVGQ